MKLFQATNLCKYISSAEVVEKISQEDQVHLIYSRVTYHHDKYKMLKKEMSQQKAFDQFKNDIETALKELYIINNVLTAFEKAPDNNYISLLNGALLETNEAIDRLKTIEDFTHYQTNVNMCQNILDAYKNTTMLRAELQNELGIDKPVEVLIMNEGVIDSNTPANRLGNEDNYTY
jgi:chaperonin cofactor prefoldin